MRKSLFLLVAACLTSFAVFAQTKNSVNQISVNSHELVSKQQKFTSSQQNTPKWQEEILTNRLRQPKSKTHVQKNAKFDRFTQGKQHKDGNQTFTLDSVVSPSLKYTYQYDASGNMILDRAYNRTAGQWEEWHRNEYSYDANRHITLHVIYNNINGSPLTEQTKF